MAAEEMPCSQDNCTGVRLPTTALCLAHAAEQAPEAFTAELERIRAEGTVNARGVAISAELLAQVLDAVPRKDDRPTFTAAQFDWAIFQGDIGFDRAIFQGDAGFIGATFHWRAVFTGAIFQGDAVFTGASFQAGGAVFDGATFQRGAAFNGATFQRGAGFNRATFHSGTVFDGVIFQCEAVFDGATFQDYAWFDGATLKGEAVFKKATFKGEAAFRGANFQRRAGFEEADFQGRAGFDEASFQREAVFKEATFQGETAFPGAIFKYEARFDGATFEAAREFGPVWARRQLVLDAVTFKQRARIEAAADTVCARRALFPAGVQLRLRWAQVVLDDADLAAPSILTAATQPLPGEERWARLLAVLSPPRSEHGWPRLLSVRRADVAGLTVSNVDLRTCRFLGAHNLDTLRIEGEGIFGSTPHPQGFSLGRGGLFGGWTTRLTIAEEQHWRAELGRKGRREGWHGSEFAAPDWLHDIEVPTPGQVAGLYRALRKAHEDVKDEPGAADFYYGEMEMRRQARHDQARQRWREVDLGWWAAARTEHAILWVYWLIAGYGLRAWRALATFLVLLVVAAGLFAYGNGFASTATATATSPTVTTPPASTNSQSTQPTNSQSTQPTTAVTPDTSFGGALAYSARTVIGLTRDPQPRLTRFGDVVQILLRIVGPVLLGLAVLSVRGRIRR